MNFLLLWFLLACVACFLSACSGVPRADHVRWSLDSCKKQPARLEAIQKLVATGYLHLVEYVRPFDVFHKPKIVKKGFPAEEPYTDQGRDVRVAVCEGGASATILAESADKDDLKALETVLATWECQMGKVSGRSATWDLQPARIWDSGECRGVEP